MQERLNTYLLPIIGNAIIEEETIHIREQALAQSFINQDWFSNDKLMHQQLKARKIISNKTL